MDDDKFISMIGSIIKCAGQRHVDEQIKIIKSLSILLQYGNIDGSHHKMWVIDQVVRILAGDQYDNLIAFICDGEDGPDTYEWDIGIAP